jgi:hypothetical protein
VGLRSSYERWAEKVLPKGNTHPHPPLSPSDQTTHIDPVHIPDISGHTLKRDADGLPLFPSLKLDEETSGSLRKIVQVYLEYVWGTSILHID